MHGRSRMTIDPRIPAMPGRSTSGFHRPGRPCLVEGEEGGIQGVHGRGLVEGR